MGIAAAGGLGGLGSLSTAFKILGAGFSMFQKARAARAQEDAIRTRMAEERAAAADRGASRAKKLGDIIARQAVMARAKGLGAGSSVFNQVSQDSFDAMHMDDSRDRMNLAFSESAAKSEISAIEAQTSSAFFSTFGTAFGAAFKQGFGEGGFFGGGSSGGGFFG